LYNLNFKLFITCLVITISSFAVIATAQTPVITPKTNIIIPLDSNGELTITPGTIANITDTIAGNNLVTITPATLSCSDVGTKNITISAVNTISNPSAVTFGNVVGIVSDPAGNLALSDYYYSNLRYITAGGTTTTMGTPGTPYSGSGYPNYAYPGAMTIDKAGNIYFASNDDDEHDIYKITPSGAVTMIVGEYNSNSGTVDGPLTTATFSDIMGITVDASGNLFITQDTRGVREISTSGIVTTIAGSKNGYSGFQDGQGSAALFSYPEGIVVDAADNLYVVDGGNFAIRKISSTGYVSTLAGGTYGYADGTGTAAKFSTMYGIAIDSQGNLYVVDNGTYIRKITPAGVVTTVAGSANSGLTNGQGTAATFNQAYALTVDGQGNIYVDDRGNDVIRKITPGGNVTTYAGSGQQGDTNGQIITESGNPVSVTIPVTVKSSLAITSTYPNTTIAVNGNCPTLIPDYTKTATASDNCGHNIKFVQIPAAGTPISGTAPVNITITASDNLGQQATASFTLTPDNTPVSPPTVAISTPQNTVCANSEVEFTAQPANAGTQLTYQWLLNGNPVGSNLPTYSSNAFKNNDNISCSLTVLNGCSQTVLSNTVTLSVNNNLTPSVAVTTAADTVCQATSVTFIADTVNAGKNPSYQWHVNGVNAGGNSNTFITGALNDGDHISCTLTNNDPSCLTVNSVTSQDLIIHITALQSPSVTIVSNSSIPVCQGSVVTFTATTANAVNPNYQWMVNGQNAGSNQNSFSTSSLVNGDQISCAITGGGKCLTTPTATSNIITANVRSLLTPPVVTITSVNDQACAGTPVTFEASANTSITGLVYNWQINGIYTGTAGPSFTSPALSNGDQVSCIASSDISCVAPVNSNILTVTIYPQPSISVGNPPVIKQGETVTLNPIVSGDIMSYQWFPAAGLSNNSVINPVASPSHTTTYHLTVTSNTGCQDTASVTVTVLTNIVIPNAFTPNGDGINDLWQIPSLIYYPKSQVSIFNRYGALVFHSAGYSKAWDGTYNGKQIPNGTYYYLINLENGSSPYSGYVEVIR
jgi:gliding motility-associated-like protein